MNIKTVTHRKNPIVVNQFTGVTRGFVTSPGEAASVKGFQKFMPELRGFHIPIDHVGFLFISIEKTKPHQALEIAEKFNFLPIGKIVVVVDRVLMLNSMAFNVSRSGPPPSSLSRLSSRSRASLNCPLGARCAKFT